MISGLFTASRGMTNILAKQDASAHNLANAHTTGFKRVQLATSAMQGVSKNEEKQLYPSEKQTLSGAYTDFTQGPLAETGNPFDMALAGPGFLTVQGLDGPRYTRNGTLTLNAKRQLVTLGGQPVLDENQRPIELKEDDLQIRGDGSFFSGGNRLGKLGMVEFPDPRKLLAGGDGLFRNPDPQNNPSRAARDTQAQQGFLEGSNVDVVSAMVAMIAQNRNYESDMRAIQSIDQTLGKAVNEIGRVN